MIKDDAQPSETNYVNFLPPPEEHPLGDNIDLDNVKLEPEEKVDCFAAEEKERQKKDNHNKSEQKYFDRKYFSVKSISFVLFS